MAIDILTTPPAFNSDFYITSYAKKLPQKEERGPRFEERGKKTYLSSFLVPRSSILLFFQAAFDNLGKRLDFQARPPHQGSVYVLHGHEFRYVFRLYAAAIENAEPLGKGN